MEISDVMTREVRSCRPEDSLQVAAGMMWDGDCGCIPVADGDGKLVGMLTDRDVAMAAYTQARCLTELVVSDAMSPRVFTVAPSARLEMAERLMRKHQVRRLPVVDDDGRLQGIVSLNDLAVASRSGTGRNHLTSAAIGETLAGICAHRTGNGAAT